MFNGAPNLTLQTLQSTREAFASRVLKGSINGPMPKDIPYQNQRHGLKVSRKIT
jgi:hypothetical protein